MLFLGLASNYSGRATLSHLFSLGTSSDYKNLEKELAKRFKTEISQVSLIYSGRTAIFLALKSFLDSGKIKKGDHVAEDVSLFRRFINSGGVEENEAF